MAYWMSFPGTSDMPLTAQLISWRKFRAYQRQTRRRFKDFETTLRQRRQRHGLDGPVSLNADLEQQSALERWIEFQNYHLARLEALEKQRDGRRRSWPSLVWPMTGMPSRTFWGPLREI